MIGDWFRLSAGKSVDIEDLFRECPGGIFSCQLLIEQEDQEYKQVPFGDGVRPVLPIFTMTKISDELVRKMEINLEISTSSGPIFGPLK